ncbi:hypothetical protein T439DRAFT_320722 [Meredithblackwellia eburnea MCA 4105]
MELQWRKSTVEKLEEALKGNESLRDRIQTLNERVSRGNGNGRSQGRSTQQQHRQQHPASHSNQSSSASLAANQVCIPQSNADNWNRFGRNSQKPGNHATNKSSPPRGNPAKTQQSQEEQTLRNERRAKGLCYECGSNQHKQDHHKVVQIAAMRTPADFGRSPRFQPFPLSSERTTANERREAVAKSGSTQTLSPGPISRYGSR